jgi:CBS domain-containing protein
MACVESAPNFAIDLLCHTPATDLIRGQKEVLNLASDSTVAEAAKFLIEHCILGAPVLDSDTSQVLGLVDAYDILAWVFSQIQRGAQRDSSTKIPAIMNFSGGNPWDPAFQRVTAATVLSDMTKDRHLHRVPVLDIDGKVSGIISQCDIIEYLVRKCDEEAYSMRNLRAMAQHPMSKFGLGKAPCMLVQQSDKIREVFQRMISEGVSGAAIVAENGLLVGGFGPFDALHIFMDESFDSLEATVYDFKEKWNLHRLPVTVRPDSTMLDVWRTLTTNRVHSAFVERDEKPLSIVTLTDILKAISTAGISWEEPPPKLPAPKTTTTA